MTQFTIQIENPEEEKSLVDFLNERNFQFLKEETEEERKFILTNEMEVLIEERLKEDRTKAENVWDALKEIRAKYAV